MGWIFGGLFAIAIIILAVGLFFVIPALVGNFLRQNLSSKPLISLLEGITRILILIGYMVFCGAIPDVRRTFQYHGAEHKTVYCHENGLPLTPENARQFSALHPRFTPFCKPSVPLGSSIRCCASTKLMAICPSGNCGEPKLIA